MPNLRACDQTFNVWASTPFEASKITIAPSNTLRLRSTYTYDLSNDEEDCKLNMH